MERERLMSQGRVEDELAIRNLIARMAQVTDSGEMSDYAAMLHEEARWQMPVGEPTVGRDAIVAAGSERRAAGTSGPGTRMRHFIGSVLVDVDGDGATSCAYWQFVSTATSPPTLRAAGTYRDRFVRTADGWVFRERVSTTD